MVKITFLGGCREVGRSAILIESKDKNKCILDYGIRFHGEERLPYDFNKDNLKAIALTHSHIDHSGALPYLYKDNSVPLFTNPVSLALTKVLIKDMISISNYYYPFGFRELNRLIENSYNLDNGFRQKVCDNIYLTFFNAGHIPGSVSILIEVDNKKILYTGDINTKTTNTPIGDIYVVSAKNSEMPTDENKIVDFTDEVTLYGVIKAKIQEEPEEYRYYLGYKGED